jgi:hypothetical protein
LFPKWAGGEPFRAAPAFSLGTIETRGVPNLFKFHDPYQTGISPALRHKNGTQAAKKRAVFGKVGAHF